MKKVVYKAVKVWYNILIKMIKENKML